MVRVLAVAVISALTATGAVAQTEPAGPRATIVEELRLDASAEDFPRVGQLYVGPRGHIVVPIQMDQQLRIYDSTGKKVAMVGHRGGGPGEFGHLSMLGWTSDSIWVTDIDQRRTTYFAPNYKLLRTQIWPPREMREGPRSSFDPLVRLSDGSWLGQGITWASSGNGYASHILVQSASGAMRTLLSTSTENDPRMMWVAGFGRSVPFSLQPQYAFARDGGRVGELKAPIPERQASHYTVTVIDATGDTAFARAYPFRGEPIPRRVADSVLAAMIPTSGHAVEGPADLPLRFQAMAKERMSSWFIPVETITLGLDRTVWISMRLSDEGRAYLVLDREGDPVGSVVVPSTSRIRQASASRIWVTETDQDGLTSVVRYRVQGLSCNPAKC